MAMGVDTTGGLIILNFRQRRDRIPAFWTHRLISAGAKERTLTGSCVSPTNIARDGVFRASSSRSIAKILLGGADVLVIQHGLDFER